MRHPNSIFNFVRLPDIISLGNGLSGAASIYLSLNGYFAAAIAAVGVGALCDLADGKVARKMGLSSEFGKQIDSLCDLVSFILAPMVFLYSIGLQAPWAVAIEGLYVLSGISRLARFNVTGTTGGGKFFEGVPVPVSFFLLGVYFPLVWFNLSFTILAVLFLIHAVLMVSTVKIPKL
ncbi:MAG: CDP-diacylglycerol--serine O-phosphatidyltransferase [Bacteroidota bacterium]